MGYIDIVMTDHATLAKLFEAAMKEPDPVPERKPRNVLPPKNAAASEPQGKPAAKNIPPAKDDGPDSAKAS